MFLSRPEKSFDYIQIQYFGHWHKNEKKINFPNKDFPKIIFSRESDSRVSDVLLGCGYTKFWVWLY